MDFAKELLDSRGYGEYENLRPPKMPPLYVAYDPSRAEISLTRKEGGTVVAVSTTGVKPAFCNIA